MNGASIVAALWLAAAFLVARVVFLAVVCTHVARRNPMTREDAKMFLRGQVKGQRAMNQLVAVLFAAATVTVVWVALW